MKIAASTTLRYRRNHQHATATADVTPIFTNAAMP